MILNVQISICKNKYGLHTKTFTLINFISSSYCKNFNVCSTPALISCKKIFPAVPWIKRICWLPTLMPQKWGSDLIGDNHTSRIYCLQPTINQGTNAKRTTNAAVFCWKCNKILFARNAGFRYIGTTTRCAFIWHKATNGRFFQQSQKKLWTCGHHYYMGHEINP